MSFCVRLMAMIAPPGCWSWRPPVTVASWINKSFRWSTTQVASTIKVRVVLRWESWLLVSKLTSEFVETLDDLALRTSVGELWRRA